jgi:peptidoglycan hydrolase-like protein with peptidoglycan-binding domain
MKSRKEFLTAIILGGSIGLAPLPAWSQDLPAGRSQPSAQQPRSGTNEDIPGPRSSRPQELSQNDMRLIQRALQEKGYTPGNMDGRADEATRSAIRKFQQDQGIPVTGTVDEKTANQLGFRYTKNPTDRGGTAGERPAPGEPPAPR